MKPTVSLREALHDENLLGGAIPGDSWMAWRVLLMATMGEELTDEEREVFQSLTGWGREPADLVEELWCIVGRRGGKTRAAGTLGAYIAALCDHSENLAPGERGTLPIMAASVAQASRAFSHVRSVLHLSPVLGGLIEGETASTIKLSNDIDIEVRPANFKTIRSITAVAAIADEIAFWDVEGSANPDKEILEAVRPALATTGGPLIVISSPYARRGELYATFQRYYGPDKDPLILVAKGPSKSFNPSLKQTVIDRAYERDAAVASAEYGGEFRTDVEALITPEVIEKSVDYGIFERPYEKANRYFAFVDPSGGSSDAMTLAIAHREGEMAILDAVREFRPPFSPEGVVKEFCDLLKLYGLTSVRGDRYGGEWPRERFRVHGISYLLAEDAKSEIYLTLVPAMNSGNVRLLEHPRLASELRGLERRTSRGGRDLIDHAPGQHDDIANSVAGAISLVIASNANVATAVFGTYGRFADGNPNSHSLFRIGRTR